jgi:3-(3-hydroxy-phenyl)propionate hydroxylase
LDIQTIFARFVLGCDGANSTVRELMDFGYRQLYPSQHWYVTDGYSAEGHANDLIHTQICDPAQPLTFVPGACRHLRYEAMDCNPSTDYNALMTNLLAQHGAVPERVQRYTFRAGVARVWQRDGVFILGDAAHATPPFAGQGLCAGIRDAANLWWKLDAALRFSGATDWPETYQAERQPHAVAYIRRAWQIGALVQTRRPVFRHVRDAVLKLVHHLLLLRKLVVGKMVEKPLPGKSPLLRVRLTFPQTRMANGRLSDERLGNGWALVKMAGTSSPALPKVLPTGIPLKVVELNADTDPAGELARWMRKHHKQWVVVRPDKLVLAFGTHS